MDKLELIGKCELVQEAKDNMDRVKWLKFGIIGDDHRKMEDGQLHDICGKIVGQGSTFFEAGEQYKVTIEKV
jgi:hypothetical protein